MKHSPSTDPTLMAVGIAVAVGLLILYIWMHVWAWRDAEQRGKNGCLVALVVFFLGFPIGLIVWMIFRPDGTSRKRRRR